MTRGAIRKAERAIQRILLDLEDDGAKVESVRVDTRNFANLAVEIIVEEPRRG